jgi:hypothetical protein
MDPETVRWAAEGLEITGSDVPVPFAEAVETGKLGRHGGEREGAGRPKKGEGAKPKEEKQDRFPTLNRRGRDYDLARLDRDNPELAARVRLTM